MSLTPCSISDRYILLGNHYDAWVFGSIDPLSGTAALTEIIHSLGDMLKQGIYDITSHNK